MQICKPIFNFIYIFSSYHIRAESFLIDKVCLMTAELFTVLLKLLQNETVTFPMTCKSSRHIIKKNVCIHADR